MLCIVLTQYRNPYDPDFYWVFESLGVIQILSVVEKYRSLYCVLSGGSFLGSFLNVKLSKLHACGKIIYIHLYRILLIVFSFGITAGKITLANASWIPFTRDLACKKKLISISVVTAVE